MFDEYLNGEQITRSFINMYLWINVKEMVSVICFLDFQAVKDQCRNQSIVILNSICELSPFNVFILVGIGKSRGSSCTPIFDIYGSLCMWDLSVPHT